MRSIPLALTWEFWRQAWSPLLAIVTILSAMLSMIYGGLRIGDLYNGNTDQFGGLHIFCFLFVLIGLTAVICQLTDSPRYRFTLPVSMHGSILIPMINGAIAAAVGYLAIALFLNGIFNAQWTFLKPTIVLVCVLSLCQAAAWTVWSLPNLRGAIVAGVSTVLGVGVLFMHGLESAERLATTWHTMRPIEIALAVIVPTFAYAFSYTLLTLARRGQVWSATAFGRWLIAKLDVSFASGSHAATPMAAELWSDWTLKGRLLPAGPIVIAAAMCCFFLTGRFEWRSGLDAIVGFTWLQVISGVLIGLFLGHVGDRFDFHEHLATRPLSDAQLADVKLRNVLKCVCQMWGTWLIGVAVVIVCLVVVGRGPTSWQDAGLNLLLISLVLGGALVLLVSWTLTSLSASVAVLRPWLIKTLALSIPSLFVLAVFSTEWVPGSKETVATMWQWTWIVFSVAGTVALFATAFRMRLITGRRVATTGAAYALTCLIWLAALSFSPHNNVSLPLAYGFAVSSSTLPFVCIAAMPLGIWWNRHR